jgi:hypothetical protein
MGVAAEAGFALEQDDVVLTRQAPGGREARHTGADDSDFQSHAKTPDRGTVFPAARHARG